MKRLLALLLCLSGMYAWAQRELSPITGYYEPGMVKPIWVSLSGFTGEALQALQFDLYVQGFNFTNTGAQYLINGSNNGDLRASASDAFNKRSLVSKAY